MRMLTCLILSCLLSSASAEESASLPEFIDASFIDEMVDKHHFDRDKLLKLFAQIEYRTSIVDAMSRPNTARTWLQYRASFVNPERVKLGLKFWQKHQAALQRAEKTYGIPQEILVSFIGIETLYGKEKQKYRVLDSLATFAFAYPRRAEYFRGELEHYLLLAREQHWSPLQIKGSFAGALGLPQFMPSSYRKYAVDFNGNHHINLLSDVDDAIGSVANYLSQHGWVAGADAVISVELPSDMLVNDEAKSARNLQTWQSQGFLLPTSSKLTDQARLLVFSLGDKNAAWLALPNFEVIRKYNSSDYYSMSVWQLAQALKATR